MAGKQPPCHFRQELADIVDGANDGEAQHFERGNKTPTPLQLLLVREVNKVVGWFFRVTPIGARPSSILVYPSGNALTLAPLKALAALSGLARVQWRAW